MTMERQQEFKEMCGGLWSEQPYCWFRDSEKEAAEMKMWSFSLGMPWMDRIRGTDHGRCFGDNCREADLDVQRRDSDSFGEMMQWLDYQERAG